MYGSFYEKTRIAGIDVPVEAAIKVTQYFTGRSADIDGLMLNTLGGVLGDQSCSGKSLPVGQTAPIITPLKNRKKVHRKTEEPCVRE